jgi:hypothetical protein
VNTASAQFTAHPTNQPTILRLKSKSRFQISLKSSKFEGWQPPSEVMILFVILICPGQYSPTFANQHLNTWSNTSLACSIVLSFRLLFGLPRPRAGCGVVKWSVIEDMAGSI